MEWLIKRLIKVGAKVAYHGRRWWVQVHAGERFNISIKGGPDKVEDLPLGKTVWLTFESNAAQTL
jgi:hypothetical protein